MVLQEYLFQKWFGVAKGQLHCMDTQCLAHIPHLVFPHWLLFHNPQSFPSAVHLKTDTHAQALSIRHYIGVTVWWTTRGCHCTGGFFCVCSFDLVHKIVGVPFGNFLRENLFTVREVLCRGERKHTAISSSVQAIQGLQYIHSINAL